MPIIEVVQKIHCVADRLRQSGEHHAEADLLDDAANQIVDIVTRELSMRERQIYECERRLADAGGSTAPSRWKSLSEL